MTDRSWTLEPFEADDGTCPFERFVTRELSAFQRQALDEALRLRLAREGIDLARSEWLKALGEGLHEFRVRHTASEIAEMFGGEPPDVQHPPEAVLLRVFVHFYGNRIVLLLVGYDKGANPSAKRQGREIARARKLLTQFKERQRRERSRRRR
ncbi:MAG TPA: hypothetical protein VNQ73_01395 [Ilumatobacter sp.]|nr:hypothetical protein [Ilumatobacter sp.]